MRVQVRVKPGSSRAKVGGCFGDGELVVAVTERAVDGRATRAAGAAVAAAFGVRARSVTLVTGATSRSKVFEVDVDPDLGAIRLHELRGL